jgi:antitoxin component YwqK of YwqJK toxin-antitoxin module
MAKVVRTYHDPEETKLKEEYYEVDGKKEGIYKSYYYTQNTNNSKNQLNVICNYTNDILNGKFIRYYNNCYKLSENISSTDSVGQIYIIFNYINNKKNGEYKKYYENGQLWEICNYVDAYKNGEEKIYYYNGQLNKICNYIDGVKQT